jgi:hypothetical protein
MEPGFRLYSTKTNDTTNKVQSSEAKDGRDHDQSERSKQLQVAAVSIQELQGEAGKLRVDQRFNDELPADSQRRLNPSQVQAIELDPMLESQISAKLDKFKQSRGKKEQQPKLMALGLDGIASGYYSLKSQTQTSPLP